LKETAERVLKAIQERNTDSLTGNDMAQLVKAIEAEDTFANAPAVNAAIEERNKLMDGLLTKINTLIGEYKSQNKIIPTVDAVNSNAAIVDNGVITVRVGKDDWQPVFACEEIENG
jgi:hypothetical protein